MLKKYVLIEGIAGRLVADPRVEANPRRYLGMRRKPDANEIAEQVDRYEPVKVLIEASVVDPGVFAAGDLKCLGRCVAESVDAAIATINAPVKAPKKDGN